MDTPQDNPLGRELEPKLQDILNDFDQVLEKHGFPQIHVVSFTVRPEVAIEGFQKPDTECTNGVCKP